MPSGTRSGTPRRGRGLLGALIADPRPLRVERLSDDPRAVGFPPGHPTMEISPGAPVNTRGRVGGTLYLCERGEPFPAADEQAVVALAEWAGIAIDNARLFTDSERRRRELECVV